MKHQPIVTDRFTIFSHEIPRDEKLGGVPRTVFQAWFHSMDVAHPVCILTINESFENYVEWIHVFEYVRRTRVATEVLSAVESVIGKVLMDGVTDEGKAFCNSYQRQEHGQ